MINTLVGLRIRILLLDHEARGGDLGTVAERISLRTSKRAKKKKRNRYEQEKRDLKKKGDECCCLLFI